MELHIVVLAAGRGKRMFSSQPKVLAPLGNWPLLRHVVETAQALTPTRVHVVYGYGGEQVQSALGYLDVDWVYQAEQLGTGHAVAQALGNIPDNAHVLVLYGDVPLIRADTLFRLVEASQPTNLALLTVVLDNAAGYGRVLRDENNRVVGVVEDRDLTPDQRHIGEANTGLLCAPADRLRDWLARLDNDNAQGEYYLTDCIGMASAEDTPVVAGQAGEPSETQGINDRRDLARAERLLQRRQADTLLGQGVTFRDPARFDLRGALRVGRDVIIDVNVVVEGEVSVGDNVHIEPNCLLRDCVIGNNTRVMANTVIENAEMGDHCQIGPFARIRPGSRLDDRVKVGNFVEVKNAAVGKRSKINHLSYIGDAELGSEANIGAGAITCNYDGANKHVTRIGDRAFIGSNVAMVAPVDIGPDATIGAGSTLTKNAPAEQLSLGRAKQVTIEGWRRPKRH